MEISPDFSFHISFIIPIILVFGIQIIYLTSYVPLYTPSITTRHVFFLFPYKITKIYNIKNKNKK